MTEPEEDAIELLLADPEIVAWLDLGKRTDDDRGRVDGAAEDESQRAA
ncbi:MAG TPA: hypothetical protein VNH40_12510 [Gaiellaceae bacterium]|nr:hypothetical protein [Gaiellaceae bacterium]